MLMGRYGFGWMIAAWLALVVAIAVGILVIGQLPRIFA